MGLGHNPAVLMLVPQVIAQRARTRVCACASWHRARDEVGAGPRIIDRGSHGGMLPTNVLKGSSQPQKK